VGIEVRVICPKSKTWKTGRLAKDAKPIFAVTVTLLPTNQRRKQRLACSGGLPGGGMVFYFDWL
jgi:hypothetical protein